jgi:3-oxoadipate enol-lactonase
MARDVPDSTTTRAPTASGRPIGAAATAPKRLKVRGLTLTYEEAGSGPLVLFLHGVGADRRSWQPQLSGLADSFRCVAIDYPGYGGSDPAPEGSDRRWLAALLLDAVEALGGTAAHVVGLSMGGVMALEMARIGDQKLASLVLADSFAHHPDGKAIDARFQHAMMTTPMPEFASSRAPSLVSPSSPPALLAEIQAVLSEIPAKSVAWASPIVWLADARAWLKDLALPTLVIVGAEDRITPPELSLDLARGIPKAKLVVVGGAGHLSNMEQPQAFNAALRGFLDDRPPRVLFVCVGNAGRSQMAEAFARKAGLDAESAGTEPASRISSTATALMKERGIDISRQKPKALDWSRLGEFDRVVTMGCGVAESCPSLRTDEDWGLDDPLGLPPEKVKAIRDEIERRVSELAGRLRPRVR